jgi:maleate cis-trans isomerase
MYGHRARIGYCSPPFVTEVFVYEFYKMVPAGVTLMITTLEVGSEYTQQAFDSSYDRSIAAAHAMADAGASVVVLGGNPVNQSRGIENLDKICSDLAKEIGTKVVASTLAQKEAMQKLGARKVATAHMAGPGHDERHHQQMRNMGFDSVGVLSPKKHSLLAYGKVDETEAIELARELKRRWPETDCIHFASAHWATAFAIEPVERELGVSVMTSQQAIVWKALRTAGVTEPIPGFGCLFREF